MAGQVKGAVWKQYVRNMGVHLAIAILSGFGPDSCFFFITLEPRVE